MVNTAGERILDAALVSFVENGYKGTNLRDFAAGIGLSKSALYRHFESKEAIWNALLDMMEAYYDERFGSAEHMPELPKSWDEFYRITMRLIDFTIHDEKIILTRKLLLTEQFHGERVKKLAARHFMNETKTIFRSIFEKMMETGLLEKEDPDMLAFIFTSPVTALIHCCDREPEKEPEIMRQIDRFVKHFKKRTGNLQIEKRDKMDCKIIAGYENMNLNDIIRLLKMTYRAEKDHRKRSKNHVIILPAMASWQMDIWSASPV